MKIPVSVRAIPALTFRAWLTPPPLGAKTGLRDQAATADLPSFLSGDVTGFEVGSGPLVLALHGWGGRPAQMAALARAVAGSGFRVVVPELPGHAGGPLTDIKKASAAVRTVVDEIGMPEVVIGHSFASMVMRLAFADHTPPALVLMAPALDVNDALDVFGRRLGLYPWAQRGLEKRLRAWDPSIWPTMSGLLPGQFPGTEILIVHDPADEDTPFARSAELAATRPGTSIVVLEGAGHSRILSDPVAIERVTAFARSSGMSDNSARRVS